MNRVTGAENSDSAWRILYKVGGAAALTIVVFTTIQIVVFVTWPPPGFQPTSDNVIRWLTLLQNNRLLGLLDLDLLMIADYALMLLVFLALYAALRRAGESLAAIGTTLGIVGIAVYFTSNPAFSMLSLSDQYAAATTDAQRSTFVAAGQAILAISQGTPFDVGYVLEGVAGLIIAAVMLRSNVFSKVTAYVGVLMNMMMLVPPTAGMVGLFLSLISLAPMVIWLIMVSRRLFQLGKAPYPHPVRG